MNELPKNKLLKLVTTIEGAKAIQTDHHYVKMVEAISVQQPDLSDPVIVLYVAVPKEPEARMLRFLEFAETNGIKHGDWDLNHLIKHKDDEAVSGHPIPETTETSPELASEASQVAQTVAAESMQAVHADGSDAEGHDVPCENPEEVKNIHFAWNCIESELGHRDCDCTICHALTTVMDFCKPFVDHMDYDVAVPLSGKPDVDEAIERVSMINAEIVGRGCCPNFACRCSPLEKSEKLSGGATIGLMVCKKCGFTVKLNKCKHNQ